MRLGEIPEPYADMGSLGEFAKKLLSRAKFCVSRGLALAIMAIPCPLRAPDRETRTGRVRRSAASKAMFRARMASLPASRKLALRRIRYNKSRPVGLPFSNTTLKSRSSRAKVPLKQ